jgi:hypothetical protein
MGTDAPGLSRHREAWKWDEPSNVKRREGRNVCDVCETAVVYTRDASRSTVNGLQREIVI